MKNNLKNDCDGFSLFEVLVAIFISAILLGNITATLMQTSSHYHDRSVISKTEERAQMLLDLLAYEIRHLGAGMPLGQSDFDISDATLGDASLPILLNATATYVQIKLDEIQTSSTITASYTPSVVDLDFTVESANGFSVGDTVYLSDMIVGGDDGLEGVITNITGNTITIDSGYTASAAASFNAGSSIHRVSTVTFDSLVDITRDNGTGAVTLAPNSSFTLTYLDESGTTLALPLTRAIVDDSLASINIQISLDSDSLLKDGTTYTAVAQQQVHLRNLRLSRL